MPKAVVIETDTKISHPTKDYLIKNDIEIVKLTSINDYQGNADFILEYSDETKDQELQILVKRSKGLPLHIGSTRRLVLREICIEDISVLTKIYMSCPSAFTKDFGLLEDDYLEFINNDSIDICPASILEKQKELITQYQKFQYAFYDYGLWLLSMADENTNKNAEEVIGIAGLYGANPTKISYIILPEYQNQGLCTEALDFICSYAKNELLIDTIYAEVNESNTTSLHIAKKYNFILL